MAFSIGKLQFLDSLQLTMDSVENSKDGRIISFNNKREFALVKQKGIFPYDYFDDISKILSTDEMNFSTMETFSKQMEDNDCTVKEYLHIQLQDFRTISRYIFVE